MPIPAEILEVIQRAKEQEVAENALEALKAEKADIQTRLAAVNTKITNQVTIVQQARAALKKAAQAL